jgi:hypothetical protein
MCGSCCPGCRRRSVRNEIENAVRRGFDEADIGVTGTLDTVFGCTRKIAGESWNLVEQFPQQIFEMAAHFVDPAHFLHRTIGGVHPFHDFAQDFAHPADYALVGAVFGSMGKTRLPVAAKTT